jgi:hypothetical protein
MFTNLNLTPTLETCYKAFRLDVIRHDPRSRRIRFGFEPEITAKVAGAGWRVWEVSIGYAGRTYAEGKKITWRDALRAGYSVGSDTPGVWRPRWRRSVSIAVPDARGPPAEFVRTPTTSWPDVLHSLEGATNYTDWIYGLVERTSVATCSRSAPVTAS